MVTVQQHRRFIKPIVFCLLLLPALWLIINWWQAFSGLPSGLGFNPQETSNRFTGDWAMRILLATLAITPLVTVTHVRTLMLYRRMLGLFAFFYAVLHITSYVWLDMLFDWPELWKDILKRRYITVGVIAIISLLPLAVTSTNGWIKRMGAKAWRKLHRLVYPAAGLVILHFIMMRKGFQLEPLVYGAILCILLVFRIPFIKRLF